jgi:simple sugar transport system ATP-binding protein
MVLAGPAQARARGIGMVFQHFSLFDNLTVAENVALGLDGSESFAAMSARLAQVSRDYGLPLDPKREVWRLSVGERQRIEIVRMLMQNPKLLILDEPTAVLTPQEADQLFVVLERLKREGRAILYISHKLDEVKRLCDSATILRGGKKISTCDPRQETAASLARMMVGADISVVKATAARATTVPRLVVQNLSMTPDDPHGVALKDITFEVKGGEILGLAGVAGNGQDELFAALSGERRAATEDNVIVDGHGAGLMSVTERRRLGAAFVPEERLGHGTAPRMKLSENALLTGHAASGMVHHGFIDRPATLATVDKTTQAFDVRKAKRDPEAASLSGGNLQKFIVGREILREPGVLVVSQPTWGVDAGAAATIRQALLDLSGRGAAVLVISQDLDELAEIADRIAVMFHGTLSPPLSAAAATRERLGLLMGGAKTGVDRVELSAPEASHAAGA